MIMRSPKEHLHILITRETKSLLRLKSAVTGTPIGILVESAIKSYIERSKENGEKETGKND